MSLPSVGFGLRGPKRLRVSALGEADEVEGQTTSATRRR